jgi:hypothetical protein
MSGNYGAGITVKTSKNGENGESGNGTNHEENPMAGEYFERQHAGIFDTSSSFISGPEKARRRRKELEDALEVNEEEMKRMLKNVKEKKVLFFDSVEYDRLVQENIDLKNKLGMKPNEEYFYPESFGTRFYKRCTGEDCKLVEVPYTPKLPAYYGKGKQRKTNTRKSNTRKSNTRKSNTRKSNTRKSNTRKRSNF